MKKRTLSKLLCLLLILTFIFGLAACTEGRPQNTDSSGEDFGSNEDYLPQIEIPQDTVFPPKRIGGRLSISFVEIPTLEYATDFVEIIACVKVVRWLREDRLQSYFEARVIEVLKGDCPESIVLGQLGSSKNTIRGYPIYAPGNELLVFMNQGKDHYAGICANLTGYYVVRDDSGKPFLFSMSKTFETSTADNLRPAGDYWDLKRAHRKSDSVWESVTPPYKKAFAYSDLKKYIAERVE